VQTLHKKNQNRDDISIVFPVQKKSFLRPKTETELPNRYYLFDSDTNHTRKQDMLYASVGIVAPCFG
jgi:hypothetical protein